MDAADVTSPEFVANYIAKGNDIEAKVGSFFILFVFYSQCFFVSD